MEKGKEKGPAAEDGGAAVPLECSPHDSKKRDSKKQERQAPTRGDQERFYKVIEELKTFRDDKTLFPYGLTLETLHKICFPAGTPAVSLSSFRKFLSLNPDNSAGVMPKQRSVLRNHTEQLEKGLRQARAEMHEDRRNYLWTARKLGRTEAQVREGFQDYIGVYKTFRLSVAGDLVKGTLALFLHPHAQIPYHRQKHAQCVGPVREVFDYQGAVYMKPRHFCMQAFCAERGSFRNTKVFRGQPDRDILWGRAQLEMPQTQDPFDAHVIFINRALMHKWWGKDKIIKQMLHAGPPRCPAGG